MGRFQLKLICLYFPPSFHQTDGKTVGNKGKLILTKFISSEVKSSLTCLHVLTN